MMPLLKRVIAERRRIVAPLGIALLANLVVYALVVRPLAARSAGAADRASAAASTLQRAEQEMRQAQALVTGKAKADEELAAFYRKVLPADFAAARRMTYASLPALARRSRVEYEQRSNAAAPLEDDARLGRLKIRMVCHGTYESLRDFIYQLERAPEFVIVDDLTLAQGSTETALALTLNLSTYYGLASDAP